MHFALAAPGNVSCHASDHFEQVMDAGLVLHSGLVYDFPGSGLIYEDRVTRLVCVELSDATTDGVDIVVVLEGGLNGKCMYAGVFAKGPGRH